MTTQTSNWLRFKADGFTAIIPEGTTVAVRVRYADNSTSIIVLPVKEDMISKFDRIGYSVSQFALQPYMPSDVVSFTIPEFR